MAIIVQSRMSSNRVPGKMLRMISGKTLLRRVVERLKPVAQKSGLDLWVATSNERSDFPIVNACEDLEVPCFQGALSDVALRFKTLAERENFQFFARISGDSPLIDSQVVESAISLYLETGGDLVTNVSPRTFPPGQSVEVFNSKSFSLAYPLMSPQEREHLGTYFYNPKSGARVTNFESGCPVKDGLSMTVDTEDDFAKMEKLFSEYGENRISNSTWLELASLMTAQDSLR